MGERPTHPELLDWLAQEFVRSGWSLKHMHRLIMNSAVYQQASEFRKDAAEIDSSNRLLWAFPRHRLESEVIRDSSLQVAGMLNAKAGGPSVFPELPEGMPAPRGGWKLSSEEERNRRSVYIFVKRNARYPMMEAFDMPDTHESCSRRDVTVTAPQALTMLNDQRGAGVGARVSRGGRWRRRIRWRRRTGWPTRGVPDSLGEGHGRDLLPQAEVGDRGARAARRESWRCRRRCRKAWTRRTRRRSSTSARCC